MICARGRCTSGQSILDTDYCGIESLEPARHLQDVLLEWVGSRVLMISNKPVVSPLGLSTTVSQYPAHDFPGFLLMGQCISLQYMALSRPGVTIEVSP